MEPYPDIIITKADRPKHSGSIARTGDVAQLRNVRFSYDRGTTWALNGISLDIRAGERICVTGPNGSGKSTLSRILAGLVAPDYGEVQLLNATVFDVGGPHPQAYRQARRAIGAVFQNPEDQIVTTVVQDDVAFGPENLGLPREDIGHRMDAALFAVGMEDHRDADPTHMSGGQQQRIAIAGTLAMKPKMIVLDEPTAMLDAIARRDVMQVLDRLQAAGTTIVQVTHLEDEIRDADRIIRMSHGSIVEDITRESDPAAFASVSKARSDAHGDRGIHAPSSTSDAHEPSRTDLMAPQWHAHTTQPAIEVQHISQRYRRDGPATIDDLSFTVARGETVAIMGRNGSGKTTLARMLCALSTPNAGTIRVAGIDIASRSRHGRRMLRRDVGYIMQRPERQLFARTVAMDIAYGPMNQGLDRQEIDARVNEAMELLHIGDLADRSPFSLSGGQQRLVAIAGVLACRPNILIMDEPTASLDAEARSGIYELIRELRARGVTMVLITHSRYEADLLCDRIVRMPQSPADARNPQSRETPPDPGTTLVRAHMTSHDHTAPHRREPRPTSFVAALDPRVKLLSFLALMFTAFAVTTPIQLLCTVVMVVVIAVAARENMRRLVLSIHGFLALFVVMGLLNVFFVRTGRILTSVGPIPITTDGLMVAVLYSSRLAMVVVLGAILLDTTMPTSLTDAVGSLLSPLRHLVHTQELALVMSLALRFLPTLMMETHAIIDAQSARGGSIETGSPTQRMKALGAILVPVFAGTLRHADNLSLALDARCYEEGVHRTHWRRMHITGADIAFALVCVIYIVALLALGML